METTPVSRCTQRMAVKEKRNPLTDCIQENSLVQQELCVNGFLWGATSLFHSVLFHSSLQTSFHFSLVGEEDLRLFCVFCPLSNSCVLTSLIKAGCVQITHYPPYSGLYREFAICSTVRMYSEIFYLTLRNPIYLTPSIPQCFVKSSVQWMVTEQEFYIP